MIRSMVVYLLTIYIYIYIVCKSDEFGMNLKVPCDMVVNAMVVAMAIHLEKGGSDLIVNQVGSSRRNPLKQKEAEWHMYQYFTKNPLLDDSGKPIKVRKPIVLSFSNFQRSLIIYSWCLKVRACNLSFSHAHTVLIEISRWKPSIV